MGSLNRACIIGNLGRDAELRYTPGGAAVANFSVATKESWNDKSGQRQERTEWHRIVVWGKTAEKLSEYLTKGKQVYVEGRIETRKWQDRDGHDKYTTEIVANNLVLLGGAGGGGGRRRAPAADDDTGDGGGAGELPTRQLRDDEGDTGMPLNDDDIPF